MVAARRLLPRRTTKTKGGHSKKRRRITPFVISAYWPGTARATTLKKLWNTYTDIGTIIERINRHPAPRPVTVWQVRMMASHLRIRRPYDWVSYHKSGVGQFLTPFIEKQRRQKKIRSTPQRLVVRPEPLVPIPRKRKRRSARKAATIRKPAKRKAPEVVKAERRAKYAAKVKALRGPHPDTRSYSHPDFVPSWFTPSEKT